MVTLFVITWMNLKDIKGNKPNTEENCQMTSFICANSKVNIIEIESRMVLTRDWSCWWWAGDIGQRMNSCSYIEDYIQDI
jgi:hypothetical protein